MGSCVSLVENLVLVCHITENVTPRDIEEHDRLAANDKAKLNGVS